jgi:hypothetical protein
MGSKTRPKVEVKCDSGEHDPHTCFRCRLYSLIEEEFHPETDAHAKALLFCMAEVAGMLLCQMEPQDTVSFMKFIFEWRDISAKSIAKELGLDATKH